MFVNIDINWVLLMTLEQLTIDQAVDIFQKFKKWGFVDSYKVENGNHHIHVEEGLTFLDLAGKVEELGLALSVYFYGCPDRMPDRMPKDGDPSKNLSIWAFLLVKAYDRCYPGFEEYFDLFVKTDQQAFSSRQANSLITRYQKKFGRSDLSDGTWLPSEIHLRRRS